MKKKIVAMICTAVMTAGLVACGSGEDAAATSSGAASSESGEASTSDNTELSGSISMAGSTSMEKLANAVAESFMEKYPGVTVTAEFTGSSAGIESVIAGSVDIGNSSRALKEEEKEAGVAENIVAIDGIAVVLDPSNTVTNLTREQLISIYTGETKNWNELGGSDAPIVVVGREAGSGTRGAFEELLEIEDQCAYASELDSTGAVIAKVASTPGAIGYASLDAINDTIIAASLEGVEATAEKVKAGNYFLSRPFVMGTKGEISEQSDAVQALFEYLASDEGKEIIKAVGLITVD